MQKLEKIEKCILCHKEPSCPSEDWKLGPWMEQGDVAAHYYCILFATNLKQKGEDFKDICGFREVDIKKIVEESKQVRCFYCDSAGATIRCSEKNCFRSLHYPCGIEKRCLGQFTGDFPMFCRLHSKPMLDNYFRSESFVPPFSPRQNCQICLEPFNSEWDSFYFILSPCCFFGYMHRSCVAKTAYDSGYCFKCPGPSCCCKDDDVLQTFKRLGIFIPERPAKWEMDGSFHDIETSVVSTTYDQRFPLESTLQREPVEPEKCDYARCIDEERGMKERHILSCVMCRRSFVHKKCHLYFTNTTIKKNQPRGTPSERSMPPFRCQKCLSSCCISRI